MLRPRRGRPPGHDRIEVSARARMCGRDWCASRDPTSTTSGGAGRESRRELAVPIIAPSNVTGELPPCQALCARRSARSAPSASASAACRDISRAAIRSRGKSAPAPMPRPPTHRWPRSPAETGHPIRRRLPSAGATSRTRDDFTRRASRSPSARRSPRSVAHRVGETNPAQQLQHR